MKSQDLLRSISALVLVILLSRGAKGIAQDNGSGTSESGTDSSATSKDGGGLVDEGLLLAYAQDAAPESPAVSGSPATETAMDELGIALKPRG